MRDVLWSFLPLDAGSGMRKPTLSRGRTRVSPVSAKRTRGASVPSSSAVPCCASSAPPVHAGFPTVGLISWMNPVLNSEVACLPWVLGETHLLSSHSTPLAPDLQCQTPTRTGNKAHCSRGGRSQDTATAGPLASTAGPRSAGCSLNAHRSTPAHQEHTCPRGSARRSRAKSYAPSALPSCAPGLGHSGTRPRAHGQTAASRFRRTGVAQRLTGFPRLPECWPRGSTCIALPLALTLLFLPTTEMQVGRAFGQVILTRSEGKTKLPFH